MVYNNYLFNLTLCYMMIQTKIQNYPKGRWEYVNIITSPKGMDELFQGKEFEDVID